MKTNVYVINLVCVEHMHNDGPDWVQSYGYVYVYVSVYIICRVITTTTVIVFVVIIVIVVISLLYNVCMHFVYLIIVPKNVRIA